MLEENPIVSELENRIGYSFSDRQLLVSSLTHPSYTRESGQQDNNQRLEFLGDAVLGLVLAELLFNTFPDEREGKLTRYRSMLVKGEQLCILAREIRLGDYLQLGESEISQGGRERSSILEDAFEALLGAIYIDGGLEQVRSVIWKLYGDLSTRIEGHIARHNPKGKLQEHFQPELGNDAIEYRLTESSGPDHLREFTVELWVDGSCLGKGSGKSKKIAEENAARVALALLDTE